MNVKAILLWLWLGTGALAQGFADMGAIAPGFDLPDPDRVLEFPADHASHPGFRIEWWYLTANLTGADGVDYGVQWTLFRTQTAPKGGNGWQSAELWMGHAAITTPSDHFVAERLARGGVGQAGVSLTEDAPFHAWIDDWQMLSTAAADRDPLDRVRVTAAGETFGYALDLVAQGPLVLHGDAGYSVKSAGGQASHYYSQPFYRVEGQLDLPTGPVAVTGTAWADREWSSQPLGAGQTGWDWFSLSFDTGEKLMGFVLRDGGAGFASGTWIAADGAAHPLPPGALMAEPGARTTVAGREIPVVWHLRLPERGLDVRLDPVNPAAWMATSVPYWEGPVRITGSHAGRGYLEMTGY